MADEQLKYYEYKWNVLQMKCANYKNEFLCVGVVIFGYMNLNKIHNGKIFYITYLIIDMVYITILLTWTN